MPTLTVYRRNLARKIGGYQQIVAGAQTSPPSGAYAGTGNTALAQRLVASSDLASQDISASANMPQSRYDDSYVYALTTTPEQRRVSRGSFISNATATTLLSAGGTTPVGYCYVDRNWAAALPAATVVEVHPKEPAIDMNGAVGLHTWINRALGLMEVADRLSVTGVTGQYRYDLSAYPWLTSETQLIQAYSPEYVTGMDPYPLPGGAALRVDANVPYLIVTTPTATGSTFFVDVYRPRSSWIKLTGTWGESTVGLVNETDEATADATALVNVAWYLICDAHVQESPPGDNTDWEKKRAMAAQVAYPHLKNQELQAQARLRASNGVRDITVDSTGQVRRQNSRRSGRGGWP